LLFALTFLFAAFLIGASLLGLGRGGLLSALRFLFGAPALLGFCRGSLRFLLLRQEACVLHFFGLVGIDPPLGLLGARLCRRRRRLGGLGLFGHLGKGQADGGAARLDLARRARLEPQSAFGGQSPAPAEPEPLGGPRAPLPARVAGEERRCV